MQEARAAKPRLPPVGGFAPTLIDLMQFDDVPVGIVHEELLRLRTSNPDEAPVLCAATLEFGFGFGNVGNGERDMGCGGILARSFRQ
jgi:hypothetical protein